MPDLSYADALELDPEPRVVILGPAPCQACGAWVEWCGVEWLALASHERHDCRPFLEGQRGRDQAHRMTAAELLARRAADGIYVTQDGLEVLLLDQAPDLFTEPTEPPAWARRLWLVVQCTLIALMLVFCVQLAAKYL